MKTPYDFHTRLETVDATKGNVVGRCPFCGKDEHFFFNLEGDFLWDCKVCTLTGNVYTFIHLFWERVCQDGHDPKKGLPFWTYKQNGVKWNPFNNSYVIPTYGQNGSMNNLYKYVPENNCIYGTPGCSAAIMNHETRPEKFILLCEGHWDKMAGDAILASHKDGTSVGVPGAGTFKQNWCSIFRDSDLIICYDNDEAGRNGTEKVIKTFEKFPQKPERVRIVEWPEDFAAGYDLRDLYLEFGSESLQALEKMAKEVKSKSIVKVTQNNIIEDFSCDTFDKALTAFRTAFHTTPDTEAALALVIASIWSIKFDDMEQLWLKVIGPAGSGKTRIAKAVSASDQVVSKSTFTGLFSGWRDVNDDSDAGMIPIISGKTLQVKDADALLRQPNIEQIFSELRDFYDKDSSVTYRNRVNYDYRGIKSTFVLYGTHQLRAADHAFLGERFMAFELNLNEDDKDAIYRKVLKRSIAVATRQIHNPEEKIMSSMKGYINNIMERDLDSEIPEDMQEIFLGLSKLVALMRSTVTRNRRGRLTMPAVPEMGGRILGQVITAAFALSVVFGVSRANGRIYQIVTKMLRDTIDTRSERYKIAQAVIKYPDIMAEELREHCELSKHVIDDELDDMRELGIIDIGKVPVNGNRWRYKFILNEDVAAGLKELDDVQI